MKIHILSDLHLEFSYGRFDHYEVPDDVDVVVLAGDIHPGVLGIMWAHETFVTKGIKVVYIAGNHEFYGGKKLLRHYDKMKAKADLLGVTFLQDKMAIIDGVRFIGGTLWTDFNLFGNQPLAMIDAQLNMNDYKQIKVGGAGEAPRRLNPQHILDAHNDTLNFIMDELAEDYDGKTVVVTHHAPSEQSCQHYRGDPSNSHYATNLDRMIEAIGPDIWFHGHVHNSYDYMIDKTRVVCNPRGYEGHAINPDFDQLLVVEV